MITYTTTITGMFTVNTPDPDYVVNVLFTVSGTDGEHTAFIDGNCQFLQEPQDKSFIPYASLTKEIVLQWINEATNNLTNYYANIHGQIDSMITPPVTPQNTELPWVTALNAQTFTVE
jgi:hypothetical protein